MKYLLLFTIKIYQTFIPNRFRGKCLFNESCSNYVYRVAREDGFRNGLIALKYRYRNCRPNYYLSIHKGKVLLITVDKQVIEENLINKRILHNNENTVEQPN